MIVDIQLKPWGNSYGFLVPMSYLNMVGAPTDTRLQMKLNPNHFEIIIEKSQPKFEYSLKELLKGYTPENRHEETYWGPDVGKEIVEYE